MLHLLLTLLQAAGVAWSLPAVAAALGGIIAVAETARRLSRRRRAGRSPSASLSPPGGGTRFLPAEEPPADGPAPGDGLAPPAPGPPARRRVRRPGWGAVVALLALAIYAAGALSLWSANPDFVYHWGLKGHRFFLVHRIDYAYLERSWSWVVHPDYPNLVPERFAVAALAAGRFDEPAMMLWSVLDLGLLLAAVREGLRRAGASRFAAQGTLAAVALVLAAYGLGGRTAGGADLPIALALAAALPPLLAPPGLRGAAQIGVIAALAAAAKVEGVPLALSLMTVYAVRLLRRGPRSAAVAAAGGPAAAAPGGLDGEHGGGPGGWLRGWGPARLALPAALLGALGGPAAAVVLPWLAAVHRHHLFQAYNSGPLQPGRAAPVFAAIARALAAPEWHGCALGLALLPLLLLDRRLLGLAAVVAAQILFYLYVFFSVRIDAVTLVATSLPRLVLHLLPAVLAGAVVALDGHGHPGDGHGRPPGLEGTVAPEDGGGNTGRSPNGANGTDGADGAG